MRLNKKRIAIIIYGFLIVISINWFYKNYIKIQNVFDQMYYTRIRSDYDWWQGWMWGCGNRVTSFQKMPQIKSVSRDDEYFYTCEGTFTDYYKNEYLKEGESLTINCSIDPDTLSITASKIIGDFEIVYKCTYDVKRKILQENVGYSGEVSTHDTQEVFKLSQESGMSIKDWVQYKKYFLYDKMLTDWLAVNKSRFSIKHWGRGKFIEVLPPISILNDNE